MIGKLGLPPLKDVLAGAGGLMLSRLAPGLVQRFAPSIPVYGVAGLAVRAAAAILGGQLVGRFAGKRVGEMVTFGGLLAVADDGLGMYVYPAIGLPGALPPVSQMNAYLWGDHPAGLNAYVGAGSNVGSSWSVGGTPARLNSAARI